MARGFRRQRASVVIQVLLALVVLLGFTALTTDYGLQVLRQRRLQDVTDSAALAAGPELSGPASNARNVAESYASFNGVNRATATVADSAITVTATDTVPTPFARVLNPDWSTATVRARSTVQATLTVEDAMLRPISLMSGPFGTSNVGRWLGVPAHLALVLHSNGKKYSDQPGDVGSATADVVPIDLQANGSVDAYIAALKYGMSGSLSYDTKGGSDWLASMMFVNNKPVDWAANLAAWQAATWRAVAGDADSILARSGPGTQYADDTWDHFQPGNPRFVAFLEVDRTTGGGNKVYDTKLMGYLGFYIESMDYDPVAHTATINGRFVEPAVRSSKVPSTLPAGDDHGIRTFCLVE